MAKQDKVTLKVPRAARGTDAIPDEASPTERLILERLDGIEKRLGARIDAVNGEVQFTKAIAIETRDKLVGLATELLGQDIRLDNVEAAQSQERRLHAVSGGNGKDHA